MTSELKSGGEGDSHEDGALVEVRGIFKRERMAKCGLPDEGTRSTGLGGPGWLSQHLQERYVWLLLLLFVGLFNSEKSHFADKL